MSIIGIGIDDGVIEVLKKANITPRSFFCTCDKCKSIFITDDAGAKFCGNCARPSRKISEEYGEPEFENIGRKRLNGVYSITCGKCVYVGESINVRKRWEQHITDLKSGVHANSALQAFYNKGYKLHFKTEDVFAFVDDMKKECGGRRDVAGYIKLMQLVKEREVIRKYKEAGAKVINMEDTLGMIESDAIIVRALNDFDKNNIHTFERLSAYKNGGELTYTYINKLLKHRK